MFVTISLRKLLPTWKLVAKLFCLVVLLLYIVPKIVLALSGISHPPANQKLREDPIKESPMKVELMHCNG